jgi:hypothetical protein
MPVVEGVPVMAPVAALSDKPGGSELVVHVYPGVPPVAASNVPGV